jgi:MFS family permease
VNQQGESKRAADSLADDRLPLVARMSVLAVALLGWTFAGTIMAIVQLMGREATQDFLPTADEGLVGAWFSRYICAFLLGAALGGLVFGWLGDRLGRTRSMGWSIVWYSLWTGAAYFADSPIQFTLLRFLACMGVGGIWPNAVALLAEALPGTSRPWIAGLMGAAANLGFMLLSWIAMLRAVTPDDWRWMMLLGTWPVILGLIALVALPESPRWLAQSQSRQVGGGWAPVAEVFQPPFLWRTLLGISLGAVPLMGNWGSANWLVPWADKVGGTVDPALNAWSQWYKSAGGALGALLGGVVAQWFGRRTVYFVISLCSVLISLYIFRYLRPGGAMFQFWTFAIGFTGTLYFGWLPLFLPELFPTRVRATGTGVSFNFGRILTALGVLGTGQLMHYFQGDYAKVGQVTCLTYVLGMVVILFAPDTSRKELED